MEMHAERGAAAEFTNSATERLLFASFAYKVYTSADVITSNMSGWFRQALCTSLLPLLMTEACMKLQP